MKQIIRDSSAYYLVGYNSTQAPRDGKFHEIRVRVKRPGVQVRARRGYWAYSEEDIKRALAGPKPGPPAEITKALNAIAPMTNRRYIRTWIGSDKGQDGLTRVTLLWEPLPATPGVRRDDPRRVTVLATSPSGDVVYRGRVPTELAAPGNGGIIRFQAPPGKLDLRLTIEGDGTGTLDSEDRELMVPDLSAPEIMLSTPRLWFARNAREFTALTTGLPPAPTATRDFRRTDRLLVRLDAYAPANAPTTVTAQLLNQRAQDDRRAGDRARRSGAELFGGFAAGAASRRGSICSRSPQTAKATNPLPSWWPSAWDPDDFGSRIEWISDCLTIEK